MVLGEFSPYIPPPYPILPLAGVSPLPIFVVFFVNRGDNPLNNVYGVKKIIGNFL
jgi:hypothetical protein